MTLQDDFIAVLIALAPEGITARQHPKWSNTGLIYFQDDDFQTILGVSYNFQDGYAGFNLTETTEEERQAIGARETGSRPADMTWIGWGYCRYALGQLKQVRDGVDYLLNSRVLAIEEV